MPTSLLGLFVLGPAAVVVSALSGMLWRERTSAANGRIALLSGAVLTLWAVVATALAYRGAFQPQAAETVPPVGVTLVIVLSVVFVSLAASASLLMVRGEAPALWALPAGIGDILIAITAP